MEIKIIIESIIFETRAYFIDCFLLQILEIPSIKIYILIIEIAQLLRKQILIIESSLLLVDVLGILLLFLLELVNIIEIKFELSVLDSEVIELLGLVDLEPLLAGQTLVHLGLGLQVLLSHLLQEFFAPLPEGLFCYRRVVQVIRVYDFGTLRQGIFLGLVFQDLVELADNLVIYFCDFLTEVVA